MMQENTLAPSPSTSAIERTIAFGPYRLLPRRLALLEAGKPVALGSRALAILIALVERAGELVTKEEIVAQVWPNVFVEEGNLRVHIAALRRALGDGQGGLRYIENIPGRGYRFVAPLDVADAPAVPAEASAALGRLNTLPAPLTRMIGRAAFVDAIVRRVGESRLVTITGPGGIGKSTVAFAAAHELAPSFPDGVIFLDLAPVLDPKLVPSSLTAMVGLAGRSEDPLPGLVRFLKDRRALILLDSCEHVIEAAAQMVDVLSRSLPRLQFLATTREPLGVEGERVFPLAPLDLPAERDRTVSGALASPAVQLFVERATAVLDCFDLTPDNVGFVTEICRRLDGMPLAIEMAAGRVNTLSPAEIASLLDNRFRLLTRGRRTALPRHQTLRATLDWSESLLPPAERLILRRIGIFAGWFTAHGAEAVLPGEGMTLADVVEGIASLVTKSLVAADVSGPVAFYRLLDTTRAYALEKLEEAGERDRIAHLHAGHCFGLFQRASIEWETLPTADWLALYRRSLNDLRAALDWAYSPQGDPQMGVLLAVAAAPLWLELSLMEECRTRMQQALDHLGADDDRLAMRVHSALAWSQMYTTRASQETGAVWRKVLVLAENVEDDDYRSRALWGLWADSMNRGEFRDALALAGRFSAAASGRGLMSESLIGERMAGAALHFLGKQAESRRLIEGVLARYRSPDQRSHIVRFQFDQEITARITLSRVQWLQGEADKALATIAANIEQAERLGHPLSLGNALAQSACPIAVLCGDLPAAERYTALLLDLTGRESLDVWQTYGLCFEGQIGLLRGDPEAARDRLVAGAATLRRAAFVQYLTPFLLSLAEAHLHLGCTDAARAAMEEANERAARTDERWCGPELARMTGEVCAQDGGTGESDALFRGAMDQARSQGAPAWELRVATSLARSLAGRGDRPGARAALEPVLASFHEGFGTLDLRIARVLLDDLGR